MKELEKLKGLLKTRLAGVIVGNGENAYTIAAGDIKLYGEYVDTMGDFEYWEYITTIAGIDVRLYATFTEAGIIHVVVSLENGSVDGTVHVNYDGAEIILG